MKFNYPKNSLARLGRWLATVAVCVSAFTLVWQSPVFSNIALASSNLNLIAAADVGDQVQEKVRDDARSAKGFIQDAKEQVKETAINNANRVDEATEGDNNFLDRKAQRDAGRIQRRAEEDASRTSEAVDNTKNAIERTVDSIKDALSS